MQKKPIVAALLLAWQGLAQAEPALEEVVVTAPQDSAPLTVVTHPKKPHQPVPAHDGADYLKTIPGFSVIRKGGTDGDPVLRGMAGSRLNILLDGEQILGGCGYRMDPPTAYVYPAAYSRITVLKGPQSVLHGAGASAGSVSFKRDAARLTRSGVHGDAALTLGSFGRNDLNADVVAGNGSFYAQGVYTRSDMGDYQDGAGRAVHSAYTRWSANGALGWVPEADTQVELTAAQSDGHAAYADRTMDGVKFARSNIGIKAEKKNLGGVLDGLEAQLFHNYVDHVMDNYSLRTFVASMMMPNPAVSNPDRTTNGLRLMATVLPADGWQMRVGGERQSNRHSDRSTLDQNAMPYQSMARTEDAVFAVNGLFGEANWALQETARVVMGARADRWQAEDKRVNVARGMTMVANATYGHTRSVTLPSGFVRYEQELGAYTVYAGMGLAQRFPDYWELIRKEGQTAVSVFDTLNPEKTAQLDIGLHYAVGDWRGALSGFYSKVGDFILIEQGCKNTGGVYLGRAATCGMGQSLVSIARNVAATTYGGEASVGWRASETLKFDGALSYVRGNNDTDGLPLAQLPPLELRLGASYDDRTFSAGGLLRAVAAQEWVAANQGNIAGQDIGATGGFAVFSLNAGYRLNRRTQLTAGVDNLFNRAYAEHLSRAGSMVSGFVQTTRINEPGRNLWLQVAVAF